MPFTAIYTPFHLGLFTPGSHKLRMKPAVAATLFLKGQAQGLSLAHREGILVRHEGGP